MHSYDDAARSYVFYSNHQGSQRRAGPANRTKRDDMPDDFIPPECGLILWPVGTGDSTTAVVDETRWIQIDLHQLAASQDDDDDRVAVVDRLCELAPTIGDKPYIAAFAATHLDNDHILGFAKLLDEAVIGELWFSPRVLHDNEDGEDLCDDADVFVQEVQRRIEYIAAGNIAESGDRIRIIGEDDLLGETPYSELPAECFSAPGEFFAALDGEELPDTFRVFVHGPEKGDGTEDRNDTSLAMQVMVSDGEHRGTFLTLGDLAYPDVKAIFERSDEADLLWSVFQAPHHCSKKVMYWQDEGDTAEVLKEDVLELIEANADGRSAYIVASCESIPRTDTPGANPPHHAAAVAYEERVDAGRFVVTGDHAPEPLVFELGEDGLTLRGDVDASKSDAAKSISEAAAAAGGSANKGHAGPVGFG